MILEVRDLSIGFRQGKKCVPVTSGVEFDLHPGEILALVGESGCGKSLSCLALTRLLPPGAELLSGSIVFAPPGGSPVDLAELPERKLRRYRGRGIAYVFQEPAVSLNPVFRIGDQIAEVLELHRPEIEDEEAAVIDLLRQVGIPAPESRINAFPHELSGGMQQRVMIAMALAGDPALLVADEPTTALDVTIQAQILELLDRLRREKNMAVILVTHNLGIVAELADRVAVMYAGNMVETAPTRELLSHPQHPYTRMLLHAVPHLGGEKRRLATIPGQVPPPERYPAGCHFYGRCPLAEKMGGAAAAKCADVMPEYRECGTAEAPHRCRCHWTAGPAHQTVLTKVPMEKFLMHREKDRTGKLSVATRRVTTENAPVRDFREAQKEPARLLAGPAHCFQAEEMP